MFSWKTILSIGFAELLSHTNLQMYDDSSFAAVSTPTIMGLNNKKSVCQTNSSIQIKINGILTLSSFWHYQVDVVFRQHILSIGCHHVSWFSKLLENYCLLPCLQNYFLSLFVCAIYVSHSSPRRWFVGSSCS